jgi:hypothetical protein
MGKPDNRSPGRNGYPLSAGGLSADELLRRAMRTPPPDQDPKPPKAVKAKRKKAAPSRPKNKGA